MECDVPRVLAGQDVALELGAALGNYRPGGGVGLTSHRDLAEKFIDSANEALKRASDSGRRVTFEQLMMQAQVGAQLAIAEALLAGLPPEAV